MTGTIAAFVGRARTKSRRQLLQYAAQRLYSASGAAELDLPLLPRDFVDSLELPSMPPPPPPVDGRVRIGWATLPPRAGSGGHTTLFRMVQAAQEAGYSNTLLLYDRYGGNVETDAAVIRSAWPWLDCSIAPIGERIEGFDVYVASSWPTAHVLAARSPESSRRLYFIQDFEPYFFPRGARYALAEDTYRFGFRNIALGHMVHDALAREVGVEADMVPFGCDTGTYHALSADRPRSGVVFYAKRGNDRRGFDLAVRALEIFHARHPGEPIHVCGDPLTDAAFPTISHGNVSPERLNTLYNGFVAGLALSFTNISLAAEEMLAAGVVPIVNDSALARADLPNPHVQWARATPLGIAQALSAVVDRDSRSAAANAAAASVVGRSWLPAQQQVVRLIEDVLVR